MRTLINKIDQLSEWTGRAACLLVLPVVLVTVYMVAARYFFHAPTDWGFEFTIFFYGAYFMLSGAYCLKLDGHVAVDIIARLLPETGRKILALFANLVIFLFCFILIWMGTRMAWQSTLILERSIHQTAFNPQIWWFKWIIPVSAFLLMLQNLANMLRTILSFKKQEARAE
ncbi:MAG: TRAP transporter small permease [Gracilibacteraceae bacterium]|nr:TRAP transporter small permease [Gracilibacteraceae bacterium]